MKNRGICLAMEKTMEIWANNNNCDIKPIIENLPIIKQDGTSV